MPIPEASVWQALEYLAPTPESFVWQYCQWMSTWTGSPLAYQFGAALAILGATVPHEARLTGLGGSDILCNFWATFVGDQDTAKKTTAVDACMDLLETVAPERIRFTRGSYEAAFDSFMGQPNQLILSPDGGDFFARTKGSSYQANWKPWLTQAFDGKRDSRDTKKGGKVEVPFFRLSFLMGINPEYLGQHPDESDWINGFLSRFCFLHCVAEREVRTHLEDKMGTRFEFLRNRLLQIKLHPVAPPCIGFEPEAEEFFFNWEANYRARKIPGAPNGLHTRGSLMAKKAALLLGWDLGIAQQGDPWRLPVRCVVPGIMLAEWHYQSLSELSSLLVTSPAMRLRRTVLQVLSARRPGEWVAMGEICTEGKMLLKSVREILATLLCERQVEELVGAGKERFYRLHPEPGVFDLPSAGLGALLPPFVLPSENVM